MRGEPQAADEVAQLLASPTALSAANYAEIVDHVMRHGGLDADEAEVRMRLLVEAGTRIIPVDDQMASRAGALRAEHHRRGTCAVSLADCCALATSLALGTPLATADPALAAVARACGCEVIALADSRGTRP